MVVPFVKQRRKSIPHDAPKIPSTTMGSAGAPVLLGWLSVYRMQESQLTQIDSFPNGSTGKLAGWRLQLSEFELTFVQCTGIKYQAPHALYQLKLMEPIRRQAPIEDKIPLVHLTASLPLPRKESPGLCIWKTTTYDIKNDKEGNESPTVHAFVILT